MAESVPTQEWLTEERQRILGKDAGLHVQQMFAASFKLGPRFAKDFRKLWDLPDDWKLMEAETPCFSLLASETRFDLTVDRLRMKVCETIETVFEEEVAELSRPPYGCLPFL